jgi:hypothetical protein
MPIQKGQQENIVFQMRLVGEMILSLLGASIDATKFKLHLNNSYKSIIFKYSISSIPFGSGREERAFDCIRSLIISLDFRKIVESFP